MSLWTCTACSCRYSVDAPACPQCGATQHEDGDTISGDTGVQGQRHEPQPYAEPIVVEQPAPADTPPPETSTGG